MLKPAPMKWVRVLVLDEDLETVTSRLQEAGIVQLAQSPTPGPMYRHQIREVEAKAAALSARLDRMVGLLEDAAEERAERAPFISRVTGMLRSSPSP